MANLCCETMIPDLSIWRLVQRSWLSSAPRNATTDLIEDTMVENWSWQWWTWVSKALDRCQISFFWNSCSRPLLEGPYQSALGGIWLFYGHWYDASQGILRFEVTGLYLHLTIIDVAPTQWLGVVILVRDLHLYLNPDEHRYAALGVWNAPYGVLGKWKYSLFSLFICYLYYFSLW